VKKLIQELLSLLHYLQQISSQPFRTHPAPPSGELHAARRESAAYLSNSVARILGKTILKVTVQKSPLERGFRPACAEASEGRGVFVKAKNIDSSQISQAFNKSVIGSVEADERSESKRSRRISD